jgi:hypothetical protein
VTSKEELKLVSKLIKQIKNNWTSDKCKGYRLDCPNCQGQLLLGLLESYRDLLKWDIKQDEYISEE